MASRLHSLLRPVPYVLSDWLTARAARLLSGKLRRLKKQLKGEITEEFLKLLLKAMGLVFYISKGYRRNIKGFQGRYIFEAEEEDVLVSIVFKNGKMKVDEGEIKDWDAKVTFRNSKALYAFIFSAFDVFDPWLENDISLDGNVIYSLRFFFFIKDLTHRFGMR
ncbi:hypothetical protein ACFL6S_34560 [Candidatus Poribacteria bacterium]